MITTQKRLCLSCSEELGKSFEGFYCLTQGCPRYGLVTVIMQEKEITSEGEAESSFENRPERFTE